MGIPNKMFSFRGKYNPSYTSIHNDYANIFLYSS